MSLRYPKSSLLRWESSAALSVWLLAVCLTSCDTLGSDGTDTLDELPPLTLTEELRIGSRDDPDIGFSQLGESIEVTEGDTLYVPEMSVPEIRVYAPDGRLVRRMGGRGDGPGEFPRAFYPWGVEGDTVWAITGFRPSRITMFRRDGRLAGVISNVGLQVEGGGIRATVGPAKLLPGGRFSSQLTSYNLPLDGSPVVLRIPRVQFDSTGAPVDTTSFFDLTIQRSQSDFQMVGNIRVIQTQLIPTWTLYGMAGEDTIKVDRPAATSAEPSFLTVTKITLAGDTVVRRELGYTPQAVESRVADSLVEARVDQYRSRATDIEAIRRAVRELAPIPAFYPPAETLAVGRDGSIWIRLQPAEPDGWRWAVLASDGTPRGQVLTPPGTTILWTDGEVVYAQVMDDFDVPWVVKYRLGERR